MRISLAEEVEVPPATAIAAYGSPAFYEERPARDDIEVLGVAFHEVTGSHAVLGVRFAFRGSVSSAVKAVVDPAKLTWITRTEVFPEESRTEWVVLPDHYPDRLSANGSYRFEAGANGPVSTLVTVDGDLKVRVPIVGRSVERVIVSGLRAYIADEVASIADLT